jgi:uncharacterized protein (TIGR00369 family)
LDSPDSRGPLTQINRLIRENRVADYDSPNLALGMMPREFTAGASRWDWPQQAAAALNPFGTIQGGYIAVFIDELCSTAIASVLEDQEWAMTAECKISYLRAIRPGPLTGSAQVIRRTRALAFLSAELRDLDNRLAAAATATWSIMRG